MSEPYAPLTPRTYVGKPHLDGRYVMFSARHGRLRRPDVESWERRHLAPCLDVVSAEDHNHACACPGCQPRAAIEDDHPYACMQVMTQEDGLCDECRQWCVAVDHAGRYHRLVDLWDVDYIRRHWPA